MSSGGGGNDFSDWIAGFSVGGQTGIDDYPDGDGIGSGVDNFFGTAPDTITHPLNATPAEDLAATYLWSPDLQNFYDDGNSNGAGTTTVSFSPGAPLIGPSNKRQFPPRGSCRFLLRALSVPQCVESGPSAFE